MEFSEITKKYWLVEDWQDLDEAKSFSDLYLIAEKVLRRMQKPMVAVCGPIADTGGLFSVEKNLKKFNETIKGLQVDGFEVFDQMPFEDTIQRFKAEMENEKFIHDLQNDFYYPIFSSGFISDFYFIKGWETSYGSKWEHRQAEKLGIKIHYLN